MEVLFTPTHDAQHSIVWIIDLVGKHPRRLLSISVKDDYRALLAAWSPDGKYIFFHQQLNRAASGMQYGRPLIALPVDGGKMRVIAEATLPVPNASSLSPDGQRVALPESSGPFATWRLAVVTIRNQHQRFLTGPRVLALHPCWSPNGRWIAYIQNPILGKRDDNAIDYPQAERRRHLWVTTLNGHTQLRQLCSDNAYIEDAPQWSADGTRLLFTRIDVHGKASLWAIDSRGGAPRRIVDHLSTTVEGESFRMSNTSNLYGWWQPL